MPSHDRLATGIAKIYWVFETLFDFLQEIRQWFLYHRQITTYLKPNREYVVDANMYIHIHSLGYAKQISGIFWCTHSFKYIVNIQIVKIELIE